MSPARTDTLRGADGCSRGFTLVELTIALALSSILLVGMGAAISMSIRAVDKGTDAASRAIEAGRAVEMIAADSAVATGVTSATDKIFALTVPDRDADGVPELITYTYDPVAQTLTRQYKGLSADTVASSVSSLAFSFVTHPGPTTRESAEQLLIGFDDSASAVQSSVQIATLKSAGQYLRPSFSADTIAWSISRVNLRLSRSAGAGGTLKVAICTASSSLQPNALVVLAQATVTVASLDTTPQWVPVPIGPVNGLSPLNGVCIVLSVGALTTTSASVDYETGTGLPFNSHFMTAPGLVGWSTPDDSKDMRYAVYGTVTTSVQP